MGEVYTDYEAEQFLRKYLPVAKHQLVQRADEIKIKLPFVLKIISKDALHKSEINGVRILHQPSEVESNFSDLLKIAKEKRLKLDGILVQEYSKGIEAIIGIKIRPNRNLKDFLPASGVSPEKKRNMSANVCGYEKLLL